jgi:flagellar motor switch protein FliG
MADSEMTQSSTLSGPQKAAAILLTMDKQTSAQLIKQLTPDELRDVTRAAARLGTVSVVELEQVVEEYTADFSAGASLMGDLARARALLEDAVPPDQIAEILSQVMGDRAPDVWEGIGLLPENRLATFLKSEHPLTATYILSRVGSASAAKAVPLLPRDLRNQVLCQLIAAPVIAPAVLPAFESALRANLLGGAPRASGDDHRARIAEIINGLTPADAEDAMRMLLVERPQDAEAVRALLFSFTDLPKLPQRARALLFDKVPTEIVVLALRGTDVEFREPVLSAMASRSRRLVEGELASPGTSSPTDTVKARRHITDLVLKMAQRGEIELPEAESVPIVAI